MTLEKAIEILENQYKRHKVGGDTNYRDAVKLGIEALKEVKRSREEDYIGDTGLLPGEERG